MRHGEGLHSYADLLHRSAMTQSSSSWYACTAGGALSVMAAQRSARELRTLDLPKG
jgi:hypothetical protein